MPQRKTYNIKVTGVRRKPIDLEILAKAITALARADEQKRIYEKREPPAAS